MEKEESLHSELEPDLETLRVAVSVILHALLRHLVVRGVLGSDDVRAIRSTALALTAGFRVQRDPFAAPVQAQLEREVLLWWDIEDRSDDATAGSASEAAFTPIPFVQSGNLQEPGHDAPTCPVPFVR